MNKRGWYSVSIGMVVVAAITALVALSAAGCGDPANAGAGPLKIGEADQGKTFTVKVGQTIEIALAGNPTTGYAWAAALDEKDAALLEQVGEPAYVQDATEGEVVGAGGTYTFTFKAVSEGEATITLVYARAWESVAPLNTYQVTIVVE